MYPSSFLGALVVVWRMVAELFSRLVCLRRFTRSFAVHYFRALVHQASVQWAARSPHHDSAFSHHSIATLGIQLSEGIVFAWWAKDEDLRHQRVAIRGPGAIEHLRRF